VLEILGNPLPSIVSGKTVLASNQTGLAQVDGGCDGFSVQLREGLRGFARGLPRGGCTSKRKCLLHTTALHLVGRVLLDGVV
jgi:hypothetical protein